MTGNGISREELAARAAELARKQDTLEMLRQSLADWERAVAWDELSETQREQLLRLAEESAVTLRSMIARLEVDVAGGPAGQTPADSGDQRGR